MKAVLELDERGVQIMGGVLDKAARACGLELAQRGLAVLDDHICQMTDIRAQLKALETAMEEGKSADG